jgi:hypothetical protein
MQDNHPPSTHPKRNQSELALKWWDAKQVKLEALQAIKNDRDHLRDELVMLREENTVLTRTKDKLTEDLKQVRRAK